MRLMILIIALVLGGFMLLNAVTQRKQKRHLNEDFGKKILDPTEDLSVPYGKLISVEKEQLDLSEQDPLLENLTPLPLPPISQEITVNNAVKDLDNPENNNNQGEDFSKEREYVALTILPKHSKYFSSSAVIASLRKNNFRLSKQKLYHRHIQDNPQFPIMYSVGTLAKSPYFDPQDKMKQLFPGILIYMPLDIADLEQTFEKMLTCARQLSALLNAQICDENRAPLSMLALKRIREKIKKLQDAPRKELQEW